MRGNMAIDDRRYLEPPEGNERGSLLLGYLEEKEEELWEIKREREEIQIDLKPYRYLDFRFYDLIDAQYEEKIGKVKGEIMEYKDVLEEMGYAV